MFHLLAFWTASLGVSAVNTALGITTDQSFGQQNGRYQSNEDLRIRASYVAGDGLLSARVNTPSLRQISLPYLDPVEQQLVVLRNAPIVDQGQYGPLVQATEDFVIECSRNANAAAPTFAGVWMSKGIRPAQQGPSYTVRAVAAITNVVGSWAVGAMTLDQTLPSGRYQIQGMSCIGTGVALARLVFPSVVFRPGVLGQETVNAYPLPQFRRGNFGVFGEFMSYAQPSLEVFGSAAGSAQTVYLDLVKIG